MLKVSLLPGPYYHSWQCCLILFGQCFSQNFCTCSQGNKNTSTPGRAAPGTKRWRPEFGVEMRGWGRLPFLNAATSKFQEAGRFQLNGKRLKSKSRCRPCPPLPQDTSVLVSGSQAKSSKPQQGHLTHPEFVQSQNWQMRPLL